MLQGIIVYGMNGKYVLLQGMQLRKVVGVSEVTAEHVVVSGKIGVEVLTKIFKRVLYGESMPEIAS